MVKKGIGNDWKQTHVRIYVKDLNFLRRRFPNINAAEIIRTLKKNVKKKQKRTSKRLNSFHNATFKFRTNNLSSYSSMD